MKRPHLVVRQLALLACLAVANPALSQTPRAAPATTLSVFLDCGFRCDEDFIRTEINFVNWVRDRAVADVHVLVTTQTTGGGGTEFTLAFLGLQRYAGVGDTLTFSTQATATDDETRRAMTRVIKTGLVPFIARTTLAERLVVSMTEAPSGAAQPSSQTKRDPWNFWVFTTGLNGNLNGDRNNHFSFLNGSISARRTTELWKTTFSLNENYNQSTFHLEDTTLVFIRRSYNFNQLAVRSLGPRLSAGLTSSTGSSTFENKKFSFRVTPAVEYDIFPYSESTRRMLTLQYAVGVEGFRYQSETIYGKLQDVHPLHTLALNLSQNQPWGSVNIGADGGQYLDMTDKNYASLFVGTNVRLFKGFNLNLGGNYSAIRNQIFLPKRDASEQEILLQQRQLATNYSYFVFFGINYTFGSVLNNVVNPRFGRDGGGGMMISF